jgi:hypothetical protein
MDDHLRVPLDPQVRAELKKRADTGDKKAQALYEGSIDQQAGSRDVADPFTGKGMTAPGMRYGAQGSTISLPWARRCDSSKIACGACSRL